MEQHLPDRVTRLEQRVDSIQKDVIEIKEEQKRSATKEDLLVLRQWLEERDKQYTQNMWKLIYGLLILFGGMMVVMFGIKELPKLF